MRTRIVLALTILVVGCHRSPECGPLTYDPGTNTCICPAGTEWSDAVMRCAEVADGGDIGDAEIGPDAGLSTRIEILALRGTDPAPGLSVVFHDASGEPLESRVTDDSGSAVSTLPGVTGATIIDPREWGTGIYSVLGLASRDTTTFDLPPPTSAVRGVATFLPGEYTGATEYAVHSPYNNDTRSDPTVMYIAGDLTGHGTTIVAFARGGTRTAYSALFSATEETSVTLPPWSTTYQSVPVTIAGAGFENFQANATTVPIPGAAVVPVAEFMWTQSGTLDVISGLTERVILHAAASRVVGAADVASTVDETRFPDELSSGFAVDLASAPQLTAISAERADPERPSVSWSGTIATGSVARATFLYTLAGVYTEWTVFVEPTERSARLPQLPAEIAEYGPTSEVPSYQLDWIDGGDTLSWTAVRAHPLRHWSDRTNRIASTSAGGTF